MPCRTMRSQSDASHQRFIGRAERIMEPFDHGLHRQEAEGREGRRKGEPARVRVPLDAPGPRVVGQLLRRGAVAHIVERSQAREVLGADEGHALVQLKAMQHQAKGVDAAVTVEHRAADDRLERRRPAAGRGGKGLASEGRRLTAGRLPGGEGELRQAWGRVAARAGGGRGAWRRRMRAPGSGATRRDRLARDDDFIAGSLRVKVASVSQ